MSVTRGSSTTVSATHQLVRALRGLRQIDPSLWSDARTAAKLCILDTLACGIHGAYTPEGKRALSALSALYPGGDATVWGRPVTLPAPEAALANGTASHARELDDVHAAIVHPGAVVVPTVLAVAEREGVEGARVVEAVVVGYEAMVRIAKATDYLDHRRRGWHGTSTLGPFGAAAAAGWLLNLSEEAMVWALGLAGTRTGGSWAFAADGAMSKRFHPGAAARDGVLAAYLARAGFSGPGYVLEAGDGGFLRLTVSRWDAGVLAQPLNPRQLAVLETEFKFFASCKSVHSPAEAALVLREKGVRPQDIEDVVVEVNDSAMRMAGRAGMPVTIAGAQLSIPYGVAVAFLYGQAGPEVYTEEFLRSEAVARLVERVRVETSPEMDRLRVEKRLSAARLTVRLADGSRRSMEVQRPQRAQRQGLAAADHVREKFLQLVAAGGMSRPQASECWQRVMNMEQWDGASLKAFLAGLRTGRPHDRVLG